ncbi:putative pentatricopeptide repeat-containing protein At3g23330 isoform X2 [Phalaenopsis equestris]|uniref:Pentatricopeptide repeat-containing protein n=1 Tax=Phalaenopsis equestris TaxID=78828 RepID=A0A1S6YG14_PHAEQ|nr:putative pentatricopeptide repeat-containing protein At3g23330 isoform X2 [Phalaenopsis equestris]AQX44214.1 hypothetical protein [Phalaenopsis equestris]
MLCLLTDSSPAILRVLRKVAAGSGSLQLARKAHARATILGLHHHPLICSVLISAYSLFGLPSLSHFVFLHCSAPNIFLWNSLLASFSNNSCCLQVLTTFHNLRVDSGDSPDGYTLAIVAKALTELLCGRPGDARQLFDEIPVRDVASWNVLISELVNLDGGREWELVREMQFEGIKPDGFTISALLPLCTRGDSGAMILGRQIHGYIVRQGLRFGSELHVGSCLISFYCKGGNLTTGRRVFDHELKRNAFTWTAIIAGYVESRGFNDALRLFRSMNYVDKVVPNEVTVVTVLPAVGSLAALDKGKQIHGFSFRHCLNAETRVNNAFIDMYSKCGSLVAARKVFNDESWLKDAVSWSSIISCYGIHGRGRDALIWFQKMSRLGIKLDHITAVAVLSACSRTGLVEEGLEIYSSMVRNHGVVPSSEMCSCMVDMLGRAGRLEQALDLVSSLRFEPSSSIWGALFGAAASHNNHEIQHLVGKFLIQMEPENPSNYVSLSNFHACFGRWDLVAEVRGRMMMKGLRKTPGFSWIDINGKAHSFYVADKSHLCSTMIYDALDSLSYEIKEVPNFDNLTSD